MTFYSLTRLMYYITLITAGHVTRSNTKWYTTCILSETVRSILEWVESKDGSRMACRTDGMQCCSRSCGSKVRGLKMSSMEPSQPGS